MTQRTTNERETAIFSASSVLDEIAAALTSIRREDGLTFADMAAVLGKSEDQAAKYCAGSAEMGVIAYARAQREWNGRFAGGLYRLCHDSRPSKDQDRSRQSKVLAAALALSIALEDDGEITPAEVKANRGTLEAARDAIDELLRKRLRSA
jgi:hypothetical protein